MKELKDEKKFLTQLMDMLEQQLGSHTEVVLHDLKKDYANTIVDIRNGHKQDWFIKERYKPELQKDDMSFLSRSFER